MKYASLTLLFAFGFILLNAGCEQKPKNTTPPTTGDYIKTAEDVVTARVLGINFKAASQSAEANPDELIILEPNQPAGPYVRRMFKMGNKVDITLIKEGQKPIAFHMNEMDYGSLSPGDQVDIALDHKVTVNGEERPSNGKAQEPMPPS